MKPRIAGATLVLAAAVGLAGCEPEVRVIRYDPFLSRVPGAEGGQPPVGTRPVDPDIVPQGVAPDEPLVIKEQNGARRLNLRTIRHLMAQLNRAFAEDDLEIFLDQAVAARTIQHWEDQGRSPRDHVGDYLWDHQRDIANLFSRMPNGEQSATVNVVKTGPSTLRIRVRDSSAQGLNLTTLTVELERGAWKLVWIN